MKSDHHVHFMLWVLLLFTIVLSIVDIRAHTEMKVRIQTLEDKVLDLEMKTNDTN
jgi:hypothetical protein